MTRGIYITTEYGIRQDINGYMQAGEKFPSSIERYNYEDGRRRKEALFEDVNGDGVADLRAVSLFCYDDSYYKPQTNMVRLIDNNADGMADIIEYYEGDEFGICKYDEEVFDDSEKGKGLLSILFDEKRRNMFNAYKAHGAQFEE